MPRHLVAVVVQDAERLGRADRVPVEVGEHLLAARQSHVQEEDDGDVLVAELRVLCERLLDAGPAVLAVVDHEPGRHRDGQRADPRLRARVADGSKLRSASTEAVSAEKT